MDVIEQAEASMCETACLPKYCLCSTIGELTDEIKRLRQQNADLVEALEKCLSMAHSENAVFEIVLDALREATGNEC